MAILIGGIVAVIVGVVGGAIFWCPVLSVIGGIVPFLLLIGGGLAVYFGVDELRHPTPKPHPAGGPVVEEAPVEAVPEPLPEKGPARSWLISYSAQNVEVVRDHGLIAVPGEREEILRERIQVGDRVVLYALAPESRFAGVVEVTGAPSRPSEIAFKPHKEGEVWELCREVRAVRMPLVDGWADAKSLLEDLDLLEDARKGGKDLSRSFAAKLRDIPQLTDADYERIVKALGV